MERAENTARMLDVQHQSGMLPGGNAQVIGQWTAVLRRSDLEGTYFQRYSEITSRNVLTFLVADEGNPFSLVSCISAVRENAKAVRVSSRLNYGSRSMQPGWSFVLGLPDLIGKEIQANCLSGSSCNRICFVAR